MKKLFYFLAIGFGSGLSPIMPGTCGTIVGLILDYFLLSHLPWFAFAIFVLLAIFFGIYLCEQVRVQLGGEDPKQIVFDEMVGYWIAINFLPRNLFFVLSAFILFRIFDMTKPLFIGWCDKHVKGGLGIMLDDVVAGAVTAIILGGIQAIFRIG